MLDRTTVSAALTFGEERYRGFADQLALRIYRPPVAGAAGIVVLFHGGGFVRGGLEAIAPVAAAMATRLDIVVATPAYSLASHRPFPAAVEDAYAAIAWAADSAGRERWDRRRLAVAGVEAGGNLAAVAAVMARDRGGPALAAQVLVAPMLDPTLTSYSMQCIATKASRSSRECNACYGAYLPNATDRLHPYAAPASCSRVAGIAPALILTAEDDPLRDEAESYGAKLLAAGVAARVSRLPRIEATDHTWADEVWSALMPFLGARIGRSKRLTS